MSSTSSSFRTTLTAVDYDPFGGPALASFIPVTESQREIWLAAQMDEHANVAFNEGVGLVLRGALDVSALKAALAVIVARHESLHAVFNPDGRYLCVLANAELALRETDLRPEPDPQAALARETARLMGTSMDLEQGPLVLIELHRVADDCHHLLFVAHHVICDGWSSAVVMTELGALYSAAVEGRALTLPDAPSRYGDYAVTESDFLRSEEGREHEAYWLASLTGAPPAIELPTPHPRPLQRTYAADRVDVRLEHELVARLRQLGASRGCSLVVTLLSAFTAQLSRLTGAGDLVIGLASAGQALHSQPQLVGHCVNLLPLRLRPRADLPFTDLLQQTRQVVLDAYEHQGTTFGTLLPKLQLERSDGRPPLVSVVFNVDVRDDDISHTGLTVHYDTLVRQGENFEVYINIVDNGHDLVLECSCNRALYPRDVIEGLLRQYEHVLRSLCVHADCTLNTLPLVSDTERNRLLQTFASPPPTPLDTRSVHACIAARALQTPDQVAVECGEQRWSYAQLLQKADAIARGLRAAGASAGGFIGVCLPRTAELPASLLAVLKCGAAYLPLDPDLPAGRLRFMIDDAEAAIVLCSRATQAQVPEAVTRVLLEDLALETAGEAVDAAVRPDTAAYAIYTSGSTGKPKGVVAHHAGVLNCLAGTVERIPVAPDDGVLALATYAFDASVLEIFLPLVQGARLVLVTREQASDGRLLAEAIQSHRVTRIFTAPAAWRLLLSSGWQGDPRIVGVSWAEPLRRDLAAELLPRLGELWNLYGPTETTVWMLGARIRNVEDPITIGRPIPNTSAYILDAQLNPVPIGSVGELYIGGAGVALGYLKRPELDEERFVANPFGGGRLYRTGDLARWTADGDVDCLGRADHQVKLRGYRIELGEIESELCSHPAVAECASDVRDRGPGDPRLVAWVQFHPGETLTAAQMRTHLRDSLPGYMVPQHFVAIAELPRLANGKLDRKRLPDPFADHLAASARSAPEGPVEQALADIWKDVLGAVTPGREDRFVDLGGHSLLAVQVAAKLQARFGARPSLRALLMEPLAAVAASIVPASPSADASVDVTADAPAVPPGPAADAAITAPQRTSPPKPRSWLQRLLGG